MNQVPRHSIEFQSERRTRYAVVIPVLNEGDRIRRQMEKMRAYTSTADTFIVDGGSTDGALDHGFLKERGLHGLLTLREPGGLSSQLRIGLAHAMEKGYEGVILIDGNDKDGLEAVPRFIDALQSVFATETMDGLHEKRGEFVRRVADLMRDNRSQNGVRLDSVSLTRLDQAPFSSLDENNAFNAVGMRKLAEIIATNKKQRTEIEAEADITVRQTQLEATKRRLTLEQQEEEAHIGQRLEIEKVKALSDSETAKAREEATVASEHARIERERETKAREISKQWEIRKLEIEAQLTSKLNKVDSAICLAEKQTDEAKAQANAELARTDLVLAREHVQTQRERAMADRSREIAMKRVQEQGEVAAANAESDSAVLIKCAQAESQADRTKADAERIRWNVRKKPPRFDRASALCGLTVLP